MCQDHNVYPNKAPTHLLTLREHLEPRGESPRWRVQMHTRQSLQLLQLPLQQEHGGGNLVNKVTRLPLLQHTFFKSVRGHFQQPLQHHKQRCQTHETPVSSLGQTKTSVLQGQQAGRLCYQAGRIKRTMWFTLFPLPPPPKSI